MAPPDCGDVLTLGRMRIRQVTEMRLSVPPDVMLPNCDRAFWNEAKHRVDPRCVDVERDLVHVSFHSYVLHAGGKTILVDTCNGNHKPRTGFVAFGHQLETDYLGRLATLGLAPEDVDIVFCTHFHSDHVGWNTRLADGQWVPTFPKARYVFNRRELEHFQPMLRTRPDFPGIECITDSILPVIASGQADMIDLDEPHLLGEGLIISSAPGHTPGYALLEAREDGESAFFSSDIIHHPIQFLRPELCVGDEHDSVQALATRKALIDRCRDRPHWLLPGHFAAPMAGRVFSGRQGDEFRYVDRL